MGKKLKIVEPNDMGCDALNAPPVWLNSFYIFTPTTSQFSYFPLNLLFDHIYKKCQNRICTSWTALICDEFCGKAEILVFWIVKIGTFWFQCFHCSYKWVDFLTYVFDKVPPRAEIVVSTYAESPSICASKFNISSLSKKKVLYFLISYYFGLVRSFHWMLSYVFLVKHRHS